MGITEALFAQNTGIQYQAVVRDLNGSVLRNDTISVQFQIKDSLIGSSLFTENHVSVSTNDFGLINLLIGNGTTVFGDFNTVDWSTKQHFVEVLIDTLGGTSFISLGGFGFYSVPYAYHATTADSVDDADADPTNEIQQLVQAGDSLYLSSGGSIDLSHLNDTSNIKFLWQRISNDSTLFENKVSALGVLINANSFNINTLDAMVQSEAFKDSSSTNEIQNILIMNKLF